LPILHKYNPNFSSFVRDTLSVINICRLLSEIKYKELKIKLLQIGKTNNGWVKEGISEYLNRLSNYIPFEVKDLEVSSVKNKSKENLLMEEGKKILAAIKPGDYVVLLDEGGKLYNSEDFAVWVNKKFAGISNDLVFVIGGAYGFHNDVKVRSNEKLSMSPMTFTHQMIRLIFVEQLYRAMTILKNEPYHHS